MKYAADDQSATIGAWIRPHADPLAGHPLGADAHGQGADVRLPEQRQAREHELLRGLRWDPVNDPAGAAIKEVDPPNNPATGQPYNLWCAGQTLLLNGDVLVAGGTLRYDAPTSPYTPFEGLNAVLTFNPFTETWTVQPAMAHGRWYPTLVRLPNGSVLIMGGYDETGAFVTDPIRRARAPRSATPTPRCSPPRRPTAAWARSPTTPTPTSSPGSTPTCSWCPAASRPPTRRARSSWPARRSATPRSSRWACWAACSPPGTTPTASPKNLDRQRTWASAVLEPYGPAGPQKIMMIGGSASDTNGDATPTTATLDLCQEGAGQPGVELGAERAGAVAALLAGGQPRPGQHRRLHRPLARQHRAAARRLHGQRRRRARRAGPQRRQRRGHALLGPDLRRRAVEPGHQHLDGRSEPAGRPHLPLDRAAAARRHGLLGRRRPPGAPGAVRPHRRDLRPALPLQGRPARPSRTPASRPWASTRASRSTRPTPRQSQRRADRRAGRGHPRQRHGPAGDVALLRGRSRRHHRDQPVRPHGRPARLLHALPW